MFPPERLCAGVSRSGVLTSKASTSSSQCRRMSGCAGSRTASTAGARCRSRSRFSATLNPGTTPSRIRSSGTKPRPALRTLGRAPAGELGAVEPDRAADRRRAGPRSPRPARAARFRRRRRWRRSRRSEPRGRARAPPRCRGRPSRGGRVTVSRTSPTAVAAGGSSEGSVVPDHHLGELVRTDLAAAQRSRPSARRAAR